MAEPTPPVVILDKPQLADNIGAVARVMANFGLTDLRLVAPRDVADSAQRVLYASAARELAATATDCRRASVRNPGARTSGTQI